MAFRWFTTETRICLRKTAFMYFMVENSMVPQTGFWWFENTYHHTSRIAASSSNSI